MLLSGSLNGANPRLVSGRRGLILAILWGRKGGARAEVEGGAKSGAKAGARKEGVGLRLVQAKEGVGSTVH